jgi:N-acetylglucosamine kinase-like BadF-type ATPase
MPLLLGVDGGGSKTHALVADGEGRLLGFGRSGGSNYEAVGIAQAKKALAAACREAFREAAATPEQIEVGCFALAGADFPGDFEMLRKEVGELSLCQRLVITNDTIAALRSGTRRPYGIVVIMGSGVNAGGVGLDGKEFRLIGEGYRTGDWGGAGDIGNEILHCVFRARDGRGLPTALTQMVLDFFQAPDLFELARWFSAGRVDKRRIMALAPSAFEAAIGGDEVACGIISRVAKETATCAVAIMRNLDLMDAEVDVVLAGGVFRGRGPLLLDLVAAMLHAENPRARAVIPRFEPVVGAVVGALRAAGILPNDAIWKNLEAGFDDLVLAHLRQGERDEGAKDEG